MKDCKYRGKNIPPKGFDGVAVVGKSIHGGNGESCALLMSRGDMIPLCWQPNCNEKDCPTAKEKHEDSRR